MGTKTNPGEYDCYANALPDEEQFQLLARDPLAPGLTRLWAAIRTGDRHLLFSAVSELQGFVPHYAEAPETAPAAEALDCAERMRRWRAANEGAWRAPVATAATQGEPA